MPKKNILRKLVLYYFYIFLALNILIGYIEKELNLTSFLLNPGNYVRAILLVLLSISFVRSSSLNLRQSKIYMFFWALIGVLLLSFSVSGVQNDFDYESFNYLGKVLLFLLLFYFVYMNAAFFKNSINKIMSINFYVYMFNMILGLLGVGFVNYSRIIDLATIKGFFYGGNTANLLSLVFFSFFLYKENKDTKDIINIVMSLLFVFLTLSKVIYAIPFIVLVYIVRNFSFKAVFVWFFISIASIVFVENSIIKGKLERRLDVLNTKSSSYVKMLENRTVDFNRRLSYSLIQFKHQLSNLDALFFGVNRSGQVHFWYTRYSWNFSAMDYFDLMFLYGILFTSMLLFFMMRVIWSGFVCNLKYDVLMVISIIFAYSFFGGYVMIGVSASHLLALFSGVALSCIQEQQVCKKLR